MSRALYNELNIIYILGEEGERLKISITNTVLGAMPDVAWRMFWRFMTDDDVTYTPIQKTAALCLRYYVEVSDEGHSGFFDCYEDTDKDELAQALTAIGAREFADNLIEAVENGSQDNNYEKADNWFDENAVTLLEAIESYWKSNIDEFYEIVDEDYTLLPNKLTFRLSAIMASVVFFFMTVIALTQTIVIYSLFYLMFFAFASLFLALIAYCLFWRVSVKKDVITIRRPFRKKRVIRFDEISNVRRLRDKLVVYAHGKKAVTIQKEVSEYWMFLAQLDLAGKIPKVQPTDFSIKQPKVNIVTGLMWPLVAVFALILVVTRPKNPAGIYEIAFFSALVLVALWYSLCRIPIKMTILENTLTVKNVLGREKKYQVSDITKAVVYDGTTALFIHNKKIIEIASASEGYPALLKRLKDEDIPLQKKGSVFNRKSS